MDAFEALLRENLPALERFIFFRVSSRYDAEDILQETCAAAAQNWDKLKNPAAFKGWLLTIARNKCTDYYREKARIMEIPMAAVSSASAVRGLCGRKDENAVTETLDLLDSWGFGEDNCGNEVNLAPKGDIQKAGSTITTVEKEFLLDIVGRYTVTINGKAYDTVCVIDCYTYNDGVVSEQYLDRNGKTVLWRRFNRDDWHMDSYHKPWSELLPDNERLTVNGVTYVHWYDCITDYIL